jgi:hypothetical protein
MMEKNRVYQDEKVGGRGMETCDQFGIERDERDRNISKQPLDSTI